MYVHKCMCACILVYRDIDIDYIGVLLVTWCKQLEVKSSVNLDGFHWRSKAVIWCCWCITKVILVLGEIKSSSANADASGP